MQPTSSFRHVRIPLPPPALSLSLFTVLSGKTHAKNTSRFFHLAVRIRLIPTVAEPVRTLPNEFSFIAFRAISPPVAFLFRKSPLSDTPRISQEYSTDPVARFVSDFLPFFPRNSWHSARQPISEKTFPSRTYRRLKKFSRDGCTEAGDGRGLGLGPKIGSSREYIRRRDRAG